MHKVPSQLASIITDYAWHPITIGHSEANTYLLKKGYHSLYLKIQTLGSMEPLQCEKDKMEWLRGKLAVPETPLGMRSTAMGPQQWRISFGG